MVHLELRRICVIATGHAKVTEDELWKESQIKPDEHDHGVRLTDVFGITATGDFWPPIVQPGHEGQDHAADHDVVKMRDDEVGVGDVNVDAECGEKQSGETADGEEPDKSENVNHRCLQ